MSCTTIDKNQRNSNSSKEKDVKTTQKNVYKPNNSSYFKLCSRKEIYKIEKLIEKDSTNIKTHKRTYLTNSTFSDYIGAIKFIDINKDGLNDIIAVPTVDGVLSAATDKILYLNCGNNNYVNVWLDVNESVNFDWNIEISPWAIITANYILGPSETYPDGGNFYEKYKINFQTERYESFEDNYPKNN